MHLIYVTTLLLHWEVNEHINSETLYKTWTKTWSRAWPFRIQVTCSLQSHTGSLQKYFSKVLVLLDISAAIVINHSRVPTLEPALAQANVGSWVGTERNLKPHSLFLVKFSLPWEESRRRIAGPKHQFNSEHRVLLWTNTGHLCHLHIHAAILPVKINSN